MAGAGAPRPDGSAGAVWRVGSASISTGERPGSAAASMMGRRQGHDVHGAESCWRSLEQGPPASLTAPESSPHTTALSSTEDHAMNTASSTDTMRTRRE